MMSSWLSALVCIWLLSEKYQRTQGPLVADTVLRSCTEHTYRGGVAAGSTDQIPAAWGFTKRQLRKLLRQGARSVAPSPGLPLGTAHCPGVIVPRAEPSRSNLAGGVPSGGIPELGRARSPTGGWHLVEEATGSAAVPQAEPAGAYPAPRVASWVSRRITGPRSPTSSGTRSRSSFSTIKVPDPRR
jgi:hypothetical protein